jgi:polyvinyl alcohol dehydrogenase (cytochrome)
MGPTTIAMASVAAGCLIAFSSIPAVSQASLPACKDGSRAPLAASTAQWNGWSPSPTNSRFQDSATARLSAEGVKRLKLKWAFNLGNVAVARAQPVIVGGRLFTTAQNGAAYALDAATGCTLWRFHADVGIRSGVTFGDANGTSAVFFSDARATMYALDVADGRVIWKSKPAEHPASIVTATPRFYDGVIYQPISSFEEALAAKPDYQCRTFRGSVVALEAGTGKTIWQGVTIGQEPAPTRRGPTGVQQYGPSGAAVWSSPTIDPQHGALYVATGDNYSDPPTNASDAVLAMDLKTGKLLWSQQLTSGDTYNNSCSTPRRANCPSTAGPDADDLEGGKRELVVAQKTGVAYALDPDQQGKVLWQTRAGDGGPFGGSQWGSASDGQNLYVAISGQKVSAVRDPQSPRGFRFVLDPREGGGLVALDLKTGEVVWSVRPPALPGCPAISADCSPAQSAAVTVIPGVVFSGSVDGHLRAYATQSGELHLGHEHCASIRGHQRRGGPRRLDGRRRTGRCERNGFCQLRVRSMGRHAGKRTPGVFGERAIGAPQAGLNPSGVRH